MTKIGKYIGGSWESLQEQGLVKFRVQPEVRLEMRLEDSYRGGITHQAILINAYVKMKGRSYLLPTQLPFKGATPAECESLIIEMIDRLRKVSKAYRKNEDLKIEECN